jgi:small conductance mechanosensitive channel
MNLDQINMDKAEIIMDSVITYSGQIIPNIIGAILVLWIGFKIVNMINRLVATIMEKNDWDLMLESFISSLIAIILKVVVIISAAGMIGVETSSFIAMLAAAGLAIGMALSGTLQNFAG